MRHSVNWHKKNLKADTLEWNIIKGGPDQVSLIRTGPVSGPILKTKRTKSLHFVRLRIKTFFGERSYSGSQNLNLWSRGPVPIEKCVGTKALVLNSLQYMEAEKFKYHI